MRKEKEIGVSMNRNGEEVREKDGIHALAAFLPQNGVLLTGGLNQNGLYYNRDYSTLENSVFTAFAALKVSDFL